MTIGSNLVYTHTHVLVNCAHTFHLLNQRKKGICLCMYTEAIPFPGREVTFTHALCGGQAGAIQVPSLAFQRATFNVEH